MDFLAQSFGLIVCSGTDADPCTFAKLMQLVNQLIIFMVIISTFFAGAAFAWAGLKLLTSGGNESAKNEAKSIFTKVMWGYLFILGAWILVYTITTVLLKPEFRPLLGNP